MASVATGTRGRPAPGPRGIELARAMTAMRSDALAVFVALAEKYGDVYQSSMPGIRVCVVHRPEHVEHVLVANQDNYPKGPEMELMGAALGEGLLTSRGQHWRRQRSLVQPLFAKRHLEPLMGHVVAAGDDLDRDWVAHHADGTVLDVGAAMMGLTLDAVGRALFGADLTGEDRRIVSDAMDDMLDVVLSAGISPLTHAAALLPGMTLQRSMWLRPRRQRRFLAHQAGLDAVVARTIAGRRNASAGGGSNLLELLLAARDEDGRPLSDRELRDEVVTFMLAGHETTANALSWMWLLLARNPAALARMHAELDEVLGGRVPEFADADRLPWTRAVVQEAMRLYPPVWNVLRKAQDDDVIGGVHVPAGSVVVVLIYLTHRDPHAWPDPGRFDPQRFMGDAQRERPRHAFLPFAAGRRVCVGSMFALTEAVLLAAQIAQRWEFELDDPTEEVALEPLLTLRPRGGLRMRLLRR